MPVFPDWRPRGEPVDLGGGECAVYLDSQNVDFETTPFISVRRTALPAQASENGAFKSDGVQYHGVSTNEHGTRIRRGCDPAALPHGFTPEPGLWTWIELYGASFAVKISVPSLATKQTGFDRAAFADAITRSAVLS